MFILQNKHGKLKSQKNPGGTHVQPGFLLSFPSLRKRPVAVCGDPDARLGIVLAKNYPAKAYAVQTGDAIWQARQKCRDLVVVPPHYDKYLEFSRLATEIYSDYSDRIEAFGLDECWIDMTGAERLFGNGKKVADEIRRRIREKLGITASAGVSYTKALAKLSSELRKPDATSVVTRDSLEEIVWPLPVEDLLYVGPATQAQLNRYAIRTIGDLAQTRPEYLKYLLGKNGIMLWQFANGLDTAPVSKLGERPVIKSVGNSTTAPRDLISDDDVKITLLILCESVAARLREYDYRCQTVQITMRDNTLRSCQRQAQTEHPICTSTELFEAGF